MEQRVIEYEKNIGDGALFVYMKNFQNIAPEISAGSLKGKVFNNSAELMETFKQRLLADVKANQKELRYLILYNLELPQFVGFDEAKTAPVSKEAKGSTKEQAQRSNMSGNILSDAKGHLQQGMIYAKLNDYENAIREFSLAVEKQPDYAMAYSNRAAAYMQQKKLNKAFDDLMKACQIAKTEPIIYYNLTAVLSLQLKIDLALDSLDKCLDFGFNDYNSLRTDPDLVNLRKHPEYRKILDKHKIPVK